MKLSIIIPCYNAEPYIDELLECLNEQITNDVEVILIDDGSRVPYKTKYKWCKVIRQENGGASKARNTGLDNATGEYIAFIDADDLVSNNYIQTILKVIEDKPDYIYISWKTLPGGWNCDVKLTSIKDTFPSYNLCVWNRIYRADMIGDIRFNEKKLIAEDAEFIRKVREDKKKKAFISDYMYYYRSETPESLTKRFAKGEIDTKRVVYYFQHVTKDMKYLIKEFRETDKEGEVILLTNQNEIPELAKYAMIMKPAAIKATERRGEYTNLVQIVNKPIKTQVIVWTSKTYNIGGIETFIYSLCRNLCKYYDIIVLYDEMDREQIKRLYPYVRIMKHESNVKWSCDTLIVNRIIDKLPTGVTYKKVIQMVHGVKIPFYNVPMDRDVIVSVSDAVKESWELKDSEVIRNLTCIEKPKHKPLLLVSATRLDFEDKGCKRMLKLAELMNKQGTDFLWLCFSNKPLPKDAPKGMINMEPTLDILKYINMADYLVQLSDAEAFCYSIVEALSVGTPVLVTPMGVLDELNIKDGENAYIIPFDVEDVDTNRFLKIPKFEYKYDNTSIIKQWRKVLGNTKPLHDYKPDEIVDINIISQYFDIELNRNVLPGEVLSVTQYRAEMIQNAGFGRM